MEKFSPLFILLIGFLMSSCNRTYQYDVYVENQTDKSIHISYKSLYDKRGQIEGDIDLKAGESKRLISTVNITADGPLFNATANHCNLVAEYIKAYMQRAAPSTLQWCDAEIEFSTVDIQQGEFKIIYKGEHFRMNRE